jgi:GDP-4-dehydro-6-deoxy-D-mannose reductase
MRISIGDLLQLFIGLSTVTEEIKTEVDPDRLRPSDVVLLYGNSTKFMETTGWQPKYNLERTMGDLLDAWRKKIEVIKMMR